MDFLDAYVIMREEKIHWFRGTWFCEEEQTRRSMITGSSVYNKRVERLWRDMHCCVTVLYYRCFYHLEYQDLLDPLNKCHLHALLYVYLPRLSKEGWNNHNVRTAGGKTPLQLYTQGMLSLQ